MCQCVANGDAEDGYSAADNWYAQIPYAPSMNAPGQCYVHVVVEMCCSVCDEEWTSDYSWMVGDPHA